MSDSRPDIDALLAHGFCKAQEKESCEECPLHFDYRGQYVMDMPYPACEVLADILRQVLADREKAVEGVPHEP
ncbi:MAG: hypothetical protein LBQ88_16860 [Treponema sp.]|jgi:hypothetical protein|nr:hypothetical protein [Treponema sp.]